MKTKLTKIVGTVALLAALTPMIVSAATYPAQSERKEPYASTTAYSLSAGTAQRIVATSTRMNATATIPATSGRTALALQAVNCGAGSDVWINFNDVAATSATGIRIAASSTMPTVLGDTVPMANGSISAVSSGSSCTLLVTEFRSSN